MVLDPVYTILAKSVIVLYVCIVQVIQCYPGAICHPRVTSGVLNLMYF